MPRYRTAIFDLDGTLVDSLPGIKYALAESIRLVLPETVVQLPDLRPYIGPPLPELIKLLFPNLPSDTMVRLSMQFRSIYDDAGWQRTVLCEGVIKIISWLKGHDIGCFLVTNKRFHPTLQILINHNLLPFFQEFVTPDIDKKPFKSKEVMIRYLIEKHRLQPDQTIMVGDTAGDAEAARSCGLDFAFAAYGYGNMNQFKDEPIVFLLNRPSDLLRIFKRGNE